MKKRLMAGLLATVLASVLLLSACGGSAAPAEEKKEEAAAEETAESGDSSDVTLVYWSMWEASEQQGIALQEAIDAFTKETGIKVDAQFKGRQGIRQGLQPALDANTVIDVFDEDVDRVNGNWGDYLLPLEDYVKDGYMDTAAENFVGWARDAGGGTLKCIPYQFSVFAWHYNMAIFEEAGISAVPTTWDEFLDVCQKIKDAGYDPICDDTAYENSMFGYALARLGGQDMVLDVVMNGNWAETPEVLQVAQLYEDLANRGFFSSTIASSEWPNAQNQELGMGTAAMQLNGSWLPNEIRGVTGDDFQWGEFAFPDLGGKDGTDANNTSFQVFAINKKSEHPDEAFKLIQWLTKGEADQNLATKSWGIPADTSNSDIVAAQQDVKTILDATKTRYQWAAGSENNGDIAGILQNNFAQLCGGQISAQEFVDNMEAAS